MQTVYLVEQLQDTTEGRGPFLSLGYASTDRNVARAIADANEPYKQTGAGGMCRVVPVLVVDSIEEYDEGKLREKRRKALEKLTTEDKQILGLE